MNRVKFKTTRKDYQLVELIVERWLSMDSPDTGERDELDYRAYRTMDILATHLNGCPLDLRKLLTFDDFNFSHDVWGIYCHLDRTTGTLGGHFLPRCARPYQQTGGQP